MHLKHKFLPLHSAPTPGGPSLSFSLISTQCHALSTYSMCPFHTNSSQKWSCDGAQLGPCGCDLIDERQGGQGGADGWRKWKNRGAWPGQKIRYGEIQAGRRWMAIAWLVSVSAAAVDPSMQKKTSAKRSPSLCHQNTPRYMCAHTLGGNISSSTFWLTSYIQLHFRTCSVGVELA